MKNCIKFILVTITSIVFSNCKVENLQVPPTVVTKAASDVSLNSGTLNGEVISEGGKATTERGFVYSKTDINPTVSNQKISNAYGIGTFSSNLSNLDFNTTYYFRAYATNPVGTQYGSTEKLSTLDAKLPSTSIIKVSNITSNTVLVDLAITSDGGSKILESGLVIGTNAMPTLETANIKLQNTLNATSINVENLAENTTYFIRAYAKNAKGVAFSNEYSIKTLNSINSKLKMGLVAYYLFEGNTLDKSGNNFHLTNKNIIFSTDRNSIENSSCVFNGKSSYLLGPSLPIITNQITIALWVKNMRGTAGTWGCLITTQNSTKQGFLLQDNENLKYDFTLASLNGSGYTDIWSASTLRYNDWELIICTFDGDVVKLYKNGQLETEQTIGIKALSSNANLMIGSRYFNEFFNGNLDDIGIWNRVLNTEEINYLSKNSLQF